MEKDNQEIIDNTQNAYDSGLITKQQRNDAILLAIFNETEEEILAQYNEVEEEMFRPNE